MVAVMTLFAEVYEGDPIRPDMETPTPLDVVAALSRVDRARRLQHLIAQAHEIHHAALETHLRGRSLVAECVLFSGGNDSTTLAYLFRDIATHALMANTSIGIEQTRQYVRDVCASWSLPLVEVKAEDSYRDLVLGNVKTKGAGEDVWAGGFPGPGAHGTMYQRLKERAFDRARHELGFAGSQTKAATFIAGRRRQESKKREDVPLFEPDGTVIWVSPLALWTKLDMAQLRITYPDVPRNEVSDLLHMSGECLCGAYAHPGELDEIGEWFPDVRAEIEALQDEVRAAGFAEPFCTWGHGQGKPGKSGRLCGSCETRAVVGQLAFDVAS
jgi:3'-phosphoadenosine 5'-phosphosulfate sulfotransferase (PAPS reductase)/FAD synthetase